jgi:hypothetical protein
MCSPRVGPIHGTAQQKYRDVFPTSRAYTRHGTAEVLWCVPYESGLYKYHDVFPTSRPSARHGTAQQKYRDVFPTSRTYTRHGTAEVP